MQPGADEPPDLMKGPREGDDESTDGGDQNVRGKIPEHGGVDQLIGDFGDAQPVARTGEVSQGTPRPESDEIGISGGEDEPIEDPILHDEQGDGPGEDAQQREEQTPPQLFEVVHEPHFSRSSLVL